MGIMATATVPFLDRLVQNLTVLHALSERDVAALAQLLLFLEQQPAMAGDMGIMTLIAAIFGDRLMHHLALEIPALMTVKTGGCQDGGGENRQGEPDERRYDHKMGHRISHQRPPG